MHSQDTQNPKQQRPYLPSCLIFFIAMLTATLVFTHGEQFEISDKPHGSVHLSEEQVKLL